MSILVSWTNATVRGLFPTGLSHLDFDGPVENENTGGVYAGHFNGDPTTIGDFGMSAFTMLSAPVEYRQYLSGSELIKLMGVVAYSAVKVASDTDPVALYFVSIGQELNTEQEKIWVRHADYVAGVAHFLAQKYIDQSKHDELLLGKPL